jgi:hypothetical protein
MDVKKETTKATVTGIKGETSTPETGKYIGHPNLPTELRTLSVLSNQFDEHITYRYVHQGTESALGSKRRSSDISQVLETDDIFT